MSGNNTLIDNSKIGERFGESCKERGIEIEIVCERDFQSSEQFNAILTGMWNCVYIAISMQK